MWDADVSNGGFSQTKGVALYSGATGMLKVDSTLSPVERKYTAEARQTLFEKLTTQDDHLMHIIGLQKNKAGKTFFLVKNSWGEVGPYKGYINVSEAYFAMNTISLVVPRAGLSKDLLEKLNIK